MTKSILPILRSCLRGKPFYTGKMTENEHNYKGPTPICLVPRRLKCLVENATANDPEYRAIGHVNQRKGR